MIRPMASEFRGVEAQFHDEWAANIDVSAINIAVQFEGSTAPENRWIVPRLGDVQGRKLLDVGCGAGEGAVYFASRGTHSTAVDVSSGMLSTARALAAAHSVSIDTCQCSAVALPFPDESFGLVYVSNVLHHLDTETALPELRRVLKPGGKLAMWEPLSHNPIINVYRRIANKVRTADEHPLPISTVKQVGEHFSQVEFDTFWFFTLWLLIRFYVVERLDPNRVRYWKKIYEDEARLRASYYRLEKLDRLLKRIPLLKRYAWTIAVVATK